MSISPNVPSPQDSYRYETPAAVGTPRWIAVLFGVLFVALATLNAFNTQLPTPATTQQIVIFTGLSIVLLISPPFLDCTHAVFDTPYAASADARTPKSRM